MKTINATKTKTTKNLKTTNLRNLLNLLAVFGIIALISISGCIENQKNPETPPPQEQKSLMTELTNPAPLPAELKYTPVNKPIPCDKTKTNTIESDYTILAPKLMFRGSESSITIRTEDKAGNPINKCVKVSMNSENKAELFETQTTDDGEITVSFIVPGELEQGTHEITIKGDNKTMKGIVKINEDAAIFIETDKPIYKPGQTIQSRILVVNNNLLPLERKITIEIKDAKGIKIFKKIVETNILGVVSFDLPLSTELNFGTWKITAQSGDSQSKETLDIRVEKYVLPKFKINLDMPKEWFLVDEGIKGVVDVQYFFGKPVEGKISIEAHRYVGKWDKYTTFEADIIKEDNGKKEFTLKQVEYVSGTYGAAGAGSLLLNITVTDTVGHEEKTTKLLKITTTDTILQLISDSMAVKPGLPFRVLVVTKDPDGNPVDREVDMEIKYKIGRGNYNYNSKTENLKVNTKNGIKIITLNASENVTGVQITAKTGQTSANLPLMATYSPTSNFIHIIQTSKGIPNVGEEITFNVYSTGKSTIYYDIVGNGRTVFSGTSESKENIKEIKFLITPNIAKNNEAKIVAYQINPDNEVSADTLPFKTRAEFPVNLDGKFSKEKAAPGEDINISFDVHSSVISMIGVGIVDESVYALAEGRLNLQQVFDELEKRFMEPQIEIHAPEVDRYGMPYKTKGAKEILDESDVQIITSKNLSVPKGRWCGDHTCTGNENYTNCPEDCTVCGDGACTGNEHCRSCPEDCGECAWQVENAPVPMAEEGDVMVGAKIGEPIGAKVGAKVGAKIGDKVGAKHGEKLQEPSRVRQFFPETWYWNPALVTNSGGKAELQLTVPDSITTWKMHAVSSSEEGVGMCDAQLVVFQDFFVDSDIPYAVTRGEEFPIKIIIYNYLNDSQAVFIDLKKGEWFKLLDDANKEIEVPGNGVSSVTFKVKPQKVGVKEFDITARTTARADAIKKTIIVEPEGTRREIVENGIIGEDNNKITIDAALPGDIVSDSGKLLVSVTPSVVGQSINGIEDLLGMPYGCGEQNMMFFVPDVLILKYLKSTQQVNPEIQAKAEMFINTGYQRELTFQHMDGSFSAFGERDASGSLWLTDYVLLSFSEAREIKEIDEGVLDDAARWISNHQNDDGSWDTIGFVCHGDMMGGVSGKYTLTAYTTLALAEYGNADPGVLDKSREYLENNLEGNNDVYALAISTLALQKLKSDRADEALGKLMELATDDENGIHWGNGAAVETTSYSALALMEANDARASDAVRWISSQRNSRGGFSSTQDTVMAFRVLINAAVLQSRDIEAEISVSAGDLEIKKFIVNSDNFDVFQVIEIEKNIETIKLKFTGNGSVNYQVVKKFNVVLPEIPVKKDIEFFVNYDTEGIEVNDMIDIDVKVKYIGGLESAGMTLIDVGVPTGFAPVTGTLDKLLENGRITRYEVAGRKVIIYVDELPKGEELQFGFKLIAKFPVKAQIPDSKAYLYYTPEVKGEVKGGKIEVK